MVCRQAKKNCFEWELTGVRWLEDAGIDLQGAQFHVGTQGKKTFLM